MTYIRPAKVRDVPRIAEILVFNNRVNYFPIFGDEGYSFGELQVVSVAEKYLADGAALGETFVYDDGIVRGFVQTDGAEVKKLYVDTFFQGRGIGAALLEFAAERGGRWLWALEKNTRGISFYRRHGFLPTGERTPEEGTNEYLLKLERR